MTLSNLFLVVVVGLGSMWMLGFIITMFVTAVDNTLSAIDYQREIQSAYSEGGYRPQ